MFEAGRYWAYLKSGATTTAGTGTPQVELTIEVTHSADGENWRDLDKPQLRTIYLYLSDAAFKYASAKLESLGFNGDFGNMQFGADPMSKGFEVECRHEDYQGKIREKWELPGGEREVKPAAPDVVRTLNARWKQGTGQSKPPAGKPAQPKSNGTSIPGVRNAQSQRGPVGVPLEVGSEEDVF